MIKMIKLLLSEELLKFEGSATSHIYSVQKKIPQNLGDIWGEEFIQAQELFKSSQMSENCLFDNR